MRILYIEDSEADAELVEAYLSLHEAGLHLRRIETAGEMIQALGDEDWDVILSDDNLPRFGSMPALRTLKESGKDIPFIVVSGTISEVRAVEMMRAGAQDFVKKGDYVRLIPAIQREIAEAKNRDERRKAEKALSAVQMNFKELADAMPQLVWTTEGNKISYVNAKWREYFGDDFSLENWWEESVHPEDAGAARKTFEEAFRESRACEAEFRLRRKDGVYRWFLARGEPTRGPEEEPRWFGTCTDIEDSKRRAKKESFLSKAGTVLASSLDDEKTLPALANLIAEDLGYGCLIDVFGEEARERMRISAKRGSPTRFHEAVSAEEGLERAEVRDRIPESLAPFFGTEGSVLALPLRFGEKLLGNLFLVSPPIAEESFRDSDLGFGLDLGRNVAMAVQNAKLYRKAENANRAKSDFLANMSHEIRTPLGAILGFADLMTDPAQSPAERNECLSVIRRNGLQLSKLVDEILDLAKVESEKLELEKVDFSLRAVLQDVFDLLHLQAESKGLRLRVNLAQGAPERIVSDPTRLRQILINILGNAIKFTEAGEVSLEARMAGTAGAGRGVRLEFLIRDTGIGMSADQASRLFEPFVQGDSSMTRKFGGTGLGLALSRRLARALGGDLELQKSSLGEGSVFLLSIQADLPELQAEGKTPKTGESQSLSLEGRRILIVDDAPDNRTLASVFLSRAGAIVDSAPDGASGTERALAGNYDVVLMDLQMPEMDGFEALKILQSKGYGRPVIALTAHTMRGDRERCLGVGFSEHVGKPINVQKLIEIIQRF